MSTESTERVPRPKRRKRTHWNYWHDGEVRPSKGLLDMHAVTFYPSMYPSSQPLETDASPKPRLSMWDRHRDRKTPCSVAINQCHVKQYPLRRSRRDTSIVVNDAFCAPRWRRINAMVASTRDSFVRSSASRTRISAVALVIQSLTLLQGQSSAQTEERDTAGVAERDLGGIPPRSGQTRVVPPHKRDEVDTSNIP